MSTGSMIFSLLSLCFASSITLHAILPEQFAEFVFAHVQNGANTSLKTFNPVAILMERFAVRFGKNPRTPHIVWDNQTPIGVALFGYWGSGDSQKEHVDFLPFHDQFYKKFDEIIVVAMDWYSSAKVPLAAEIILSFHPKRCGTVLTKENGWTITINQKDTQTEEWVSGKSTDLAFKGVVGPSQETLLGQAKEPEKPYERVWFSRLLGTTQKTATGT